MKKERSRLAILYHVTQFSLTEYRGKDWAFSHTDKPNPGSLVVLYSAPQSKWYLSWLVDRSRPEGWSCDQFGLESIEDGELCNWHNVSFLELNRKTSDSHPEWRWTDEQHAFNDRWNRACYKQRDAYMYLPVRAIFSGDEVELGVRVRLGLSDERPSRIFPNWRKCRVKDMLEFYDSACADLQKAKKPTP